MNRQYVNARRKSTNKIVRPPDLGLRRTGVPAPNTTISRRGFLKTTGLAAAGVGVGAAMFGSRVVRALDLSCVDASDLNNIIVYPKNSYPDDHENVQWAIDHVNPNGQVLLKAGTFIFGTTFAEGTPLGCVELTDKKVKITGEVINGELSTVIIGGGGNYIPAAGVYFTLAAIRTDPTQYQPDCEICNLWFDSFYGGAIGFESCKNLNIHHNRFTNSIPVNSSFTLVDYPKVVGDISIWQTEYKFLEIVGPLLGYPSNPVEPRLPIEGTVTIENNNIEDTTDLGRPFSIGVGQFDNCEVDIRENKININIPGWMVWHEQRGIVIEGHNGTVYCEDNDISVSSFAFPYAIVVESTTAIMTVEKPTGINYVRNNTMTVDAFICAIGIFLMAWDNNIIENNTITGYPGLISPLAIMLNPNWAGSPVDPTKDHSTNYNVIKNNTMQGAFSTIIQLEGWNTYIVPPLYAHCDHNQIIGNDSRQATATGIQVYLDAGSTFNIFKNNHYGSAGAAGAAVYGNNNTFTNENFWGNYLGAPNQPCMLLDVGTNGNTITALKNGKVTNGIAKCTQMVDLGTNNIPGLESCENIPVEHLQTVKDRVQAMQDKQQKIKDCITSGGTWNDGDPENPYCEYP